MSRSTPRLGARPGVFLLAGAFLSGVLLFAHGGCQGAARAQRPTADAGSETVSVQLLAFNDFHGQLEPPGGSTGQIQTGVDADGGPVRVSAGGVSYFARHLADLRATNPNTVVVAAGDLIGASPLLSGLFHDEPTIEAMNLIGLDLVAVGNHEFDEGSTELLRMQSGGCHPQDGCQDGDAFGGARFKFLAANVATGVDRTLFPRYDVREFEGVKVAFIGMTLEGTPQIVTPTGVAGLVFQDEVETVNALVPQLRQQGVEALIVVVHEGGVPAPGSLINECRGTGEGGGISGPIVAIAKGIDDAVDVIVTGHTHQAYNCVIDGKVVTSAASAGRLVTDIDLTLSKATGDVVEAKANNLIVTRDVVEDGPVKELVTRYQQLATPLANRVIGWVAETLKTPFTQADPAGQSTLGFVIADSQLAATRAANLGGARVAFMNPGGVRADISRDSNNPADKGEVTFGEAFTTQPFGNSLVTLTLTGAQIEELLERQWQQVGPNVVTRILHPSAGFTYAFSASAPIGRRIDPASIRLDGAPLDAAATYRVTVNNFLAGGGDGFAVLTQGTNRLGGAIDSDALEAYLKAHSSQARPLAAPALNRITALP
ncbi:hypothetical protein MFUL124B02_37180 [Myxococcus fulvus 124B02]|nr:hypothetical protein MFUL124B02_37180 [Myxococcus fulvus 124B02]